MTEFFLSKKQLRPFTPCVREDFLVSLIFNFDPERAGFPLIREERTWAIAIQTVLREPKFRTEFPYFSREKRPEFGRKRDVYEPLLTAMAQVLPFLI